MFYKKNDLRELKSYGAEILPVEYDDIIVNNLILGKYSFQKVRLFKNAITIPPHDSIKDKAVSHHHSYCKDFKIAFHSKPLNLDNIGVENLYDFIDRIAKEEKSKDRLTEIVDDIFSTLPSLLQATMESVKFKSIFKKSIERVSITDSKTNFKFILEKMTTIDKLIVIEDILFNYFNIRQFIKYEQKL